MICFDFKFDILLVLLQTETVKYANICHVCGVAVLTTTVLLKSVGFGCCYEVPRAMCKYQMTHRLPQVFSEKLHRWLKPCMSVA